MSIRVLIADDHGIVAEGLKHLVEAQSDMEVIACVADGREAVRAAHEARPDVVVMDLSMPELNGADATRAIVQRDPASRVIVLSMYAERAQGGRDRLRRQALRGQGAGRGHPRRAPRRALPQPEGGGCGDRG